MSWPFPPHDFKHPKPGDRIPLGPDDYDDAPFVEMT